MLTNSFSQSRSITYLEPLRVQIQTTRSSSEISPVQPGLLQLEKNYTIRAQKRRKNKKDYVDEFIFPWNRCVQNPNHVLPVQVSNVPVYI